MDGIGYTRVKHVFGIFASPASGGFTVPRRIRPKIQDPKCLLVPRDETNVAGLLFGKEPLECT